MSDVAGWANEAGSTTRLCAMSAGDCREAQRLNFLDRTSDRLPRSAFDMLRLASEHGGAEAEDSNSGGALEHAVAHRACGNLRPASAPEIHRQVGEPAGSAYTNHGESSRSSARQRIWSSACRVGRPFVYTASLKRSVVERRSRGRRAEAHPPAGFHPRDRDRLSTPWKRSILICSMKWARQVEARRRSRPWIVI